MSPILCVCVCQGKNKGKPSGHAGGRTYNLRRRSRSSQAGLVFSVSRVSRILRKGRYAPRVGGGAPVYLAAVLEYLTAEVLEEAGTCARNLRRKNIRPKDLTMAIRNDAELNALIMKNGTTTIASGGTVPVSTNTSTSMQSFEETTLLTNSLNQLHLT